jgi:hypothetical protein
MMTDGAALERETAAIIAVTNSYPPRIQAFRDSMIKVLPRAPNNKASREALEAMPTHRVILAFVTWRMRLIPAKPRTVKLWSRGVTPSQLRAAERRLRPLLQKVEVGKDLTLHLSDLVSRCSQTSARTRWTGSIPCSTILHLLTGFIMTNRS